MIIQTFVNTTSAPSNSNKIWDHTISQFGMCNNLIGVAAISDSS